MMKMDLSLFLKKHAKKLFYYDMDIKTYFDRLDIVGGITKLASVTHIGEGRQEKMIVMAQERWVHPIAIQTTQMMTDTVIKDAYELAWELEEEKKHLSPQTEIISTSRYIHYLEKLRQLKEKQKKRGK